MIAELKNTKIKCSLAVVTNNTVALWDPIIPERPFDFDYEYDWCDHSNGDLSLCIRVTNQFVSIAEG